ncbi:hypothetical protein MO867_17430 [Microbulbifer sp. OS29]|uniref:Uncharacterized protein n=1 Tax=Microbulbifer okhotskensis TaxID=2926617 RepID=A0A9X2EQR4_9GAMM|nr:hypothetical protein [Microbulbifer okhotskensis]MCO1336116.1 hypothetical protein [Microbulbifer okhotskensis]
MASVDQFLKQTLKANLLYIEEKFEQLQGIGDRSKAYGIMAKYAPLKMATRTKTLEEPPMNLLFVCTHNPCRSKHAEIGGR